MNERNVDSILVIDENSKLEGIVTLKDIRKHREGSRNASLRDIIEEEIISVNKDDSIIDVLKVMKEKKIGYIPVVDDDKKLNGLITRSSLISVLSGQFLDDEEVGA
jgi:osmoprotectant transport system ATP-binding protein